MKTRLLFLSRSFFPALIAMVSLSSFAHAQTATTPQKTTPPTSALPAPASPTASSSNPNENFPSNPNANPTPGQKYNAIGIANSGGESGSNKSSLEHTDLTFLTDTSAHADEEYKVARLAASRASDPRVRAFAEKRVKTYEQLNQDLNTINQQKRVGLAETKSERDFESLSKKSGAEFDAAYVKYDRAAMKSAAERAQKISEKGKDESVKTLAAKLAAQSQENERAAGDLEMTFQKK